MKKLVTLLLSLALVLASLTLLSGLSFVSFSELSLFWAP